MRHFRYFSVSRREQNEVDDFSKSTSRLKSTNRDSSNVDTSGFKIQERLYLALVSYGLLNQEYSFLI